MRKQTINREAQSQAIHFRISNSVLPHTLLHHARQPPCEHIERTYKGYTKTSFNILQLFPRWSVVN